MDFEHIVRTAKEAVLTGTPQQPSMLAELTTGDVGILAIYHVQPVLISGFPDDELEQEIACFQLGQIVSGAHPCTHLVQCAFAYITATHDRELLIVRMLDVASSAHTVCAFELLRSGGTVDLVPHVLRTPESWHLLAFAAGFVSNDLSDMEIVTHLMSMMQGKEKH